MPSFPPATWRRQLRTLIRLARHCELKTSAGQQERPLQKVAYGSLVRLRRLAEAIAALQPDHAFDGRILLRSMLEIYFNYAWIRLRTPQRRAIRFLRFLALDYLKFLESLASSPDLRRPELTQAIRAVRRERTKRRYLFRITDSKGKRRWAKDWAGGATVETRFAEVLRASQKDPASFDPFLYTLYRWFSGLAHGGPLSFADSLMKTRFGLRAKPQPEVNPAAAYVGAGVVLLSAHTLASKDLDYHAPLRKRLVAVSTRYKVLAPSFANTLGMPVP